jgi:SAM-dependent MidA family methyltransferase
VPPEPGWRPWREAWADALYGEGGFYRRAEGPGGHFETSANAGGGVLDQFAAAVRTLARQHGCTTVVDVGAGRGELLRALAGDAGRRGGAGADGEPRLLGVDVVARPPGLPPDVGWLTAPGGEVLPADLTGLDGALVLANEWLDVVPLDVLAVDAAGTARLVEVDATGTERLGRPLDPADDQDRDALAWCRTWWPVEGSRPGTRVEVGLSRDRAWADLVGRVRSGVCVAVDYGHTHASRPPTGTLAAHRSGRAVLPAPDGSCDLTAEVALDSLGAGELASQRDMLQRLGVDAGLTFPHDGGGGGSAEASAPPDPSAYLLELQRSSAAAVLLDRGGLGGFGWAVSVVAIGQPDPATARVVR